MKFCTKCGAELNDDAKFCNKCGNSQINDGGSPQSSTDAASERNENVYGIKPQGANGESKFDPINAVCQAVKKSKLPRKKLYAIIAAVAAGVALLLVFLVLGNRKPPISSNREPLKGCYAVTSIEGGSAWFEDGIFSDLAGNFELKDAPLLVECESNRVTFYLAGTEEILAVGYWKDEELEINNEEFENGGTTIDAHAEIYLDTNEDSLYREIWESMFSDDEEFLLTTMKYTYISSDEDPYWNMFFYFPHQFDSFIAHVEPIDNAQFEEYLHG